MSNYPPFDGEEEPTKEFKPFKTTTELIDTFVDLVEAARVRLDALVEKRVDESMIFHVRDLVTDAVKAAVRLKHHLEL